MLAWPYAKTTVIFENFPDKTSIKNLHLNSAWCRKKELFIA